MAKEFTLKATARKDVGKGASRRLRRANKIPAIIYGINKEPHPIILVQNVVALALEDEGFYTRILNLDVDGTVEKVVLRDLQRHPFRALINHMDFQRISETEKLTMRIPLHFTGEDVAPGVKIDGGIVSHLLAEVDVSCFPRDLPEFIAVDVSQMTLNQTIHLADLQLSAGVELVALVHGENRPIVTVHIPRAAVEDVPTAATTTAVPTTAELEAAEKAKATGEEKPGKSKGK